MEKYVVYKPRSNQRRGGGCWAREVAKGPVKTQTRCNPMEDASEMRTAKSPRQIRHMLAIFATLFGE
jgi:hypothetical protein